MNIEQGVLNDEVRARGDAAGNFVIQQFLVRRSRFKAFTLVELILVMVLLVALTSLSAPQLKGFFRGRILEEEVRRFIAVSRYASSLAAENGMEVNIVFEKENNRYYLQSQEFGEEVVSRRYELNSEYRLELAEQDGESLPEEEEEAISFSPNGYISLNGPTEVMLSHVADERLSMRLVVNRSRTAFVVTQAEE